VIIGAQSARGAGGRSRDDYREIDELGGLFQ
jgi:hypothetical protein